MLMGFGALVTFRLRSRRQNGAEQLHTEQSEGASLHTLEEAESSPDQSDRDGLFSLAEDSNSSQGILFIFTLHFLFHLYLDYIFFKVATL